MSEPVFLDRDALKQVGIEIPWAKDVKAWIEDAPGRTQVRIVYLLEDTIRVMTGNLDEVKRQIAESK